MRKLTRVNLVWAKIGNKVERTNHLAKDSNGTLAIEGLKMSSITYNKENQRDEGSNSLEVMLLLGLERY